MALISYRGNLSSNGFPFLSKNIGQTVIVSGQDQTLDRRISPDNSPTSVSDAGIPQVYYVENALPFSGGYRSISYATPLAYSYPLVDASRAWLDPISGVHFHQVRANVAGDTSHVYLAAERVIIPGTTLRGSYTAPDVMFGATSGRSFAWLTADWEVGPGLVELSTGTPLPRTVNNSPVPLSTIRGIFCIADLLCFYDADTIYYVSLDGSSVGDVINLLPDLSTGTGYGSPQGGVGTIQGVHALQKGIFVLFSDNVVSGILQPSSREPFSYQAIPSSIGATWRTSAPTTSGLSIYAVGPYGMQEVGFDKSQVVFADIGDYLQEARTPRWRSNAVVYDDIYSFFHTLQLDIFADRYLVLSHFSGASSAGPGRVALVYDIALKRWGRLVDDASLGFGFLENVQANAHLLTSFQALVSFQAGGAARVVPGNSGVLVAGKYKLVRSRWCGLEEVSLDPEQLTYGGAAPSVGALTPQGFSAGFSTAPHIWNFRTSGESVSVVFQGNFNINSVTLRMRVDGVR